MAYLEHVLTPTLRSMDIVVMGNLRANKVDGVQQAIEGRGARLIDMPPYSPDPSPVEPCSSKLKTSLRAAKARTEAIETATILWPNALVSR